jgi:acyl-CoA reductase-like NAD-dependent aldehyde dehydrogenase
MSRLESFNPATGRSVGSVIECPPAEIATVIERARAAQIGWAALGLAGRRGALAAAGVRIVEAADAVGAQLTAEMGKPLAQAVGEVRSCGAGLEAELDELVAALTPQTLEDARTRSVMHYDPLGVCAAITPCNVPVAMPHWLVVPALMAGNAVILKPSEETPLTGQAYADLLGAGLPDGVLQVVHGADAQGKALVAGAVDLVAFTGSREVGKAILAKAAPDLKRVILELGGKDPLVVLADADIGRAARFAAQSSFRNAGQVCVSTERIYVPEAIADTFVEALVTEAEGLKVGDGAGDGVDIGPMVSARQRAHVVGQLDRAVAAGARLLRGGEASDRGYFLQPAVLDGVTHEMDIAREETFGPVACVIRVADEEEAVRLANDTPFGLGAVVFGGDAARTEAVARRLMAGMIGINRGIGGATGTPWVGARQSGYGYHKGTAGHRQFAQVRVISRRK